MYNASDGALFIQHRMSTACNFTAIFEWVEDWHAPSIAWWEFERTREVFVTSYHHYLTMNACFVSIIAGLLTLFFFSLLLLFNRCFNSTSRRFYILRHIHFSQSFSSRSFKWAAYWIKRSEKRRSKKEGRRPKKRKWELHCRIAELTYCICLAGWCFLFPSCLFVLSFVYVMIPVNAGKRRLKV